MNVSDIRTCIRHFLGIFLSIVVGHSVALEGFLFNFVGSESSFKCVFYMSAWLMLSTIPLLCFSRKKLGFDLENLINILVSSVGLGVAMVLSLSAYKFAPVADAFTLYYSNAVFSLVLESFAFRVYPQKLHILAIFLTLLGIITVSQPPFIFNHFQSDSAESAESQNDTLVDTRFLGCVLAVAAAITTSVWMLFLRRIENLNITFITFLQALVPVLGYNVFGAFASNKETFCIKGNLFAMSLLCINYCVNLPLLNLCLKLEPSYIVTSVRYCEANRHLGTPSWAHPSS
ncbi:uncharacterized protein LOC134845126 isoform X2 [Symsagittifera roscoffensis]|uniref:uncharacterized protein LOC134845126 isoform X2 n=1 Tax=Symsagittifera roscoffensis TaxID=84072 RepID=UPI00307BF877